MANTMEMVVHLGAIDAERVVAKIAETLRLNSLAAGEIARASWEQVLSGPAHSMPGSPPGEDTGDLARSLNVRPYTKRKGYAGFIVKPRSQKMCSILGRLSHGYYHTDKAGRVYHEGPRPSVGRAMAQCRAQVIKTMVRHD